MTDPHGISLCKCRNSQSEPILPQNDFGCCKKHSEARLGVVPVKSPKIDTYYWVEETVGRL